MPSDISSETGVSAEEEFMLALADVRLRQTSGLLESLMEGHPDPEALSRAVAAISDAQAIIKNLGVA